MPQWFKDFKLSNRHCFTSAFTTPVVKLLLGSSNIDEVIRAFLNFLFLFYFFFTKRFRTHHKALKALKAPKNTKKHQKHKNATKQKHKNANKRTRIKNALKKHLRGKKSFIRLFAFLCLRRKKIEKSLQWKCWSH